MSPLEREILGEVCRAAAHLLHLRRLEGMRRSARARRVSSGWVVRVRRDDSLSFTRSDARWGVGAAVNRRCPACSILKSPPVTFS